VVFNNEFDVVLNLADGAVGYLETDEENLKVFDIIAKALKSDGKHFMDICNAEYAELFFPKRHWQIGKNEIALEEFKWIPEIRTMLYGAGSLRFGDVVQNPNIVLPNITRLYSKSELSIILKKRGMEIVSAFSDYCGKPDSNKELQLMVYSQKK
jgi:hypothetical protein